MRPVAELPPPAAPLDAPLVDTAALRDWASYVRGALRHHAVLAGLLFLAVAGGAASTPWLLGRTWHVEAEILAQRNQVMPALGNPTRSIPGDADAPTRAATETVLRRANLISLVRQTGLLESWDANRAPLRRLKDAARELVRGPLDEDERLDSLLGLLEQRLTVRAGEGTVTIDFDWHDPQAAHRLVEAAEENFLEARHVAEVSTISEAISILEGHAAEVRVGILNSLAELERMKPKQQHVAARAPPAPSPQAEERAQLLVLLNAKRRVIADLEEFRRRRLAELQAQLAQRRAAYSEIHPLVLDLNESIRALERESPQVANLRREEGELKAEYERAGGRPEGDEIGPQPPAPAEAVAFVQHAGDDDDPAREYARARMRFAISKYESLLDRIEAARIELDTARAAFKYRYTVIRPSQVPRRPSKPNVPVLIAGGLIGGLLLAVSAATLLSLLSGRLHEPWQLERATGLRLLGRVRP